VDARSLTRWEHRWAWRLHGVSRERLKREEPLRAQLLASTLAATAAALAVLAPVLLWAGAGRATLIMAILDPALFLLLAVACYRRGATASAASLLLVGASHAAFFTISRFGLESLAGALLVLTILLCGLMVGAYFVRPWTLICCAMLLLDALVFDAGWRLALGWCAIYVASGWLVTLSARHLERLAASERVLEEGRRSAVVAERTRFAREIHDTLAQGFTGIVQQLNAAEERLEADPAASRLHLDRARQLARESLDEARRSARGLRPGALARGDLLGAMAHIGEQLTADTPLRFAAHLEGVPYALADEVEAHLLRIGQEAMTNAVRHAEAGSLALHLRYLAGAVELAVADDGRGMAGSAGGAADGHGLGNMAERAHQMGGELTVDSAPGGGTRILASVPVS
jgi:signal transduction histidine kinase